MTLRVRSKNCSDKAGWLGGVLLQVGISASELARRTAYDRGRVSVWVNAKAEPSDDALIAISSAIGWPMEKLLEFRANSRQVPPTHQSITPETEREFAMALLQKEFELTLARARVTKLEVDIRSGQLALQEFRDSMQKRGANALPAQD